MAKGILTDDGAETSDPRIFAAGEVARLLHPVPGDLVRLGHEAVAREMGAVAALSALGAPARPLPLPSATADAFGEDFTVVGFPGLADRVVEIDVGGGGTVWVYRRGRRTVGAAGTNARHLSQLAPTTLRWLLGTRNATPYATIVREVACRSGPNAIT